MRNALSLELADKFFAKFIKIWMRVPALGIAMSQDEHEADFLQDHNEALDLVADYLRNFASYIESRFADRFGVNICQLILGAEIP